MVWARCSLSRSVSDFIAVLKSISGRISRMAGYSPRLFLPATGKISPNEILSPSVLETDRVKIGARSRSQRTPTHGRKQSFTSFTSEFYLHPIGYLSVFYYSKPNSLNSLFSQERIKRIWL